MHTILNGASLYELIFLIHSTKWIPADDTLNMAPQWHGMQYMLKLQGQQCPCNNHIFSIQPLEI